MRCLFNQSLQRNKNSIVEYFRNPQHRRTSGGSCYYIPLLFYEHHAPFLLQYLLSSLSMARFIARIKNDHGIDKSGRTENMPKCIEDFHRIKFRVGPNMTAHNFDKI